MTLEMQEILVLRLIDQWFLPTVNNTIRNLLPTIAGSVIYNSTSNRMELYNGTGWVGIATVA